MVRRLLPLLAVVGGAAAAVMLWSSAAHAATAPPVPTLLVASPSGTLPSLPSLPGTLAPAPVAPLPDRPAAPEPPVGTVLQQVPATAPLPGAVPPQVFALADAVARPLRVPAAPSPNLTQPGANAPQPSVAISARSVPTTGTPHGATRDGHGDALVEPSAQSGLPSPASALPMLPGIPTGGVEGTTRLAGVSLLALVIAMTWSVIAASSRVLPRTPVAHSYDFVSNLARPG